MPDPRFAFSNFQPCQIVGRDAIVYPSVEHFYVAAKTTDLAARAHIATLSAGAAKRYGRTVELRPGWDEMKLRVMLFGLRQKFASGSPYAAQLLAHTDELVEWNTWHDVYWGRCTCGRHNGEKKNRLGVLLSFVRRELMSTAPIFSYP